jgi:3-methylfumaryl-CoA hydratase
MTMGVDLMSADGGLGRYVDDWWPSAVTTRDVISPQRAHEVAATLDVNHDIVEGCPLPPLWQWAYFLDRIPTSALGPDGHPRKGNFLPPIPNRRRMFAGGRSTGESISSRHFFSIASLAPASS